MNANIGPRLSAATGVPFATGAGIGVMLGSRRLSADSDAGTKRTLRSGGILPAEGAGGQGQPSRTVEGKPRKSLFITLD
ncbi:MAG TPA: hypothetical protein VFB20_11805 [Burkholderiales bacterium]|nr:hypothetical protein [Burkholderiales bacterium]